MLGDAFPASPIDKMTPNVIIESLTIEQLLLRTISEKLPLVLLIGQNAWASPDGSDPVLNLAFEHIGRKGNMAGCWKNLISAEPVPEDFYVWLAERFGRRSQPEWMRSIAGLPWSAIFTSSLDQSLAMAFTTSFREPQVILTSAEVPVAARSKARTPLYYLFGRAGTADQMAMPPRTRQEMRIRQNVHCIPILNRLAETVTALGLLIIDGMQIAEDWLDADQLLTAIEQAPSGRIIWCGIDTIEELPHDYRALAKSGHVLTTPTRLGTILAALETRGRFSDFKIFSDESGVISFSNGSYTPSPDLRIRVEASASIVDDSWSAFQAPLGREAEYAAFRRFHGEIEGPRSLVAGIQNGFAIVRDFEKDLQTKISAAIENHARYGPLIVHGQSGTGKSIALARLVSWAREKRRAAVLYSITRVPLSTEMDEFCAEAEAHGATATLIICDVNTSLNRYSDLLFGLRSRGRRIVLVGSTYRQIDLPSIPETFIEAQDSLSETERLGLVGLIQRFSGEETRIAVGDNRHVLINMYHLLPSSRARLARGLGKEAQSVEEHLRSRATTTRPSGKPGGVMAEKLQAVGFAASDENLLSNLVNDALQGLDDDAAKLVDYVVAPGQIGCPVPVDLLLRAMNSQHRRLDFSRIVDLFQGLDFFRWKQGETSEDFLVSPRLILEADLICRRRMLNARTEGSRLVDLIRAARLTWDAGGTERRFLLDLLQRMGPDGPKRNHYRESYLTAARALTELRTNFGVWDPSLILQESVLRREAIKQDIVESKLRPTVLEEARSAVQAALDYLEQKKGPGAIRAKANLLVERATIFGYLAIYEAEIGSSNDAIWSAYLAARTAGRAATGVNETYFPLDVSLWVPADLLRQVDLPQQYRAELEADIYSVLDRVDPNSFPFDQQVQYDKRKYVLGQVLSSSQLSEAAFEDLKKKGISAGYFLRARSIGPQFNTDAPDDATAEDLKKSIEALAFLKENWPAVQVDERCLRYYLQCRWLSATKKRLFRGEQAPLPYHDTERRDLLQTVQLLNGLNVAPGANTLRYLEAVLNWVLGNEQYALDIWRDLSRDSDFLDPRRVNRRHVLADERGNPQTFSGRIEAEGEPGRFTLRVDGLDRRIRLMQRDFSKHELGYGKQVRDFNIAFNYIGPTAEPVKRGIGK